MTMVSVPEAPRHPPSVAPSVFAELAAELAAQDPDVLRAELSRLRRENARLRERLGLFRDVPARVAVDATRMANGLPPLYQAVA